MQYNHHSLVPSGTSDNQHSLSSRPRSRADGGGGEAVQAPSARSGGQHFFPQQKGKQQCGNSGRTTAAAVMALSAATAAGTAPFCLGGEALLPIAEGEAAVWELWGTATVAIVVSAATVVDAAAGARAAAKRIINALLSLIPSTSPKFLTVLVHRFSC